MLIVVTLPLPTAHYPTTNIISNSTNVTTTIRSGLVPLMRDCAVDSQFNI